MAEGFLAACFDRSRRAVLAKLRAEHETLRLAYEAELAEYRRVLDAAHARIAHAWEGKRARLEFLARMSALRSVQRAWRRGVQRRKLQAEIDARVEVSARISLGNSFLGAGRAGRKGGGRRNRKAITLCR